MEATLKKLVSAISQNTLIEMDTGCFQIFGEAVFFRSCCIDCQSIIDQIEEDLNEYLKAHTIKAIFVLVGKKYHPMISSNPIPKHIILSFIKQARKEN